MAEGLVNYYRSDQWVAHSAGTQPSGYVHPLAVEVMAELGIDLSAGRSKSLEEFREAAMDVVVTVCDGAAENCPLWLGQGKVIHVGFPDPAEAEGTEAQRLDVFRSVRDAIHQQVLAVLDEESNGVERIH
jgi:arsenate reductase